MTEFNLVIEKGEDGYLIAEVVELPGCRTQAKNMDELVNRIKEAILLYLEAEPIVEFKPTFIGTKKVEV